MAESRSGAGRVEGWESDLVAMAREASTKWGGGAVEVEVEEGEEEDEEDKEEEEGAGGCAETVAEVVVGV